MRHACGGKTGIRHASARLIAETAREITARAPSFSIATISRTLAAPPDLVTAIASLPDDELFQLYGACIKALEIHSCATNLVSYNREETLNALIAHIITSRTLRETIDNIAAFNRFLEERGYSFALEEEGDLARITISLSPFVDTPSPLLDVAITLFLLNILCWMTGNRDLANGFHFPEAARPYDDILSVLLRDRHLHYGGNHSEIRLHRMQLDLPTKVSRADISEVSLHVAKNPEYVAAVPADNMTARVNALFAAHDPAAPRLPDLARTADLLAVSVPTLCRHLRQEGTSFMAIKQTWQQNIATTLLRDRALTVETIARRLGFNSSRSFRRAYIGWTGLRPSEARPKSPPPS